MDFITQWFKIDLSSRTNKLCFGGILGIVGMVIAGTMEPASAVVKIAECLAGIYLREGVSKALYPSAAPDLTGVIAGVNAIKDALRK